MYTGYKEFKLNEDQLANFYTGLITPEDLGLVENEYLILTDENGTPIDKYCIEKNQFRKVNFKTINNKFIGTIKPRNLAQELAFDLLTESRAKVKLIRGVYGSGKDMIMSARALECLEQGKFGKIVFIRPNVTVANVPDIGYLKGTMEDKLGWTLGPLYDKVGGQEGVDMLVQNGQLELVPLLFIRGRSFDNSIIYVSEGQNTTTEIIKLILSRAGDNTEVWINGDNHAQCDKRVYEQDNGLTAMCDKLMGNSLFGTVYLDQTERGDVANLANLLD